MAPRRRADRGAGAALNAHDPLETLLRQIDTPVVVVTAASAEGRSGCIAGFHNQCGIDPPRYAAWLSRSNATCGVALGSTHLGVHFLDEADGDLVDLFGSSMSGFDKFTAIDWDDGLGGVPLLTRCPNRLVIELSATHDDGEQHLAFAGTIVAAEASDGFVPLRRSAAIEIRRSAAR